MRQYFILVACAVLTGVAGCATGVDGTTRADTQHFNFAAQSPDTALVLDQADALEKMSTELVRRSTLRGAAAGALVGCGLVVVAAGNGKNCVAGAATSGLVGAAIGNAAGKRAVDRQVELVSANALVRSIRGMNDHMDALDLTLPELLAEQDAELADLTLRRDAGALTEAEFDAQVEAIRLSRAHLATTLTETARNAETTQTQLEEAADRGQTGLDWHMHSVGAIAREATSARSTISLL